MCSPGGERIAQFMVGAEPLRPARAVAFDGARLILVNDQQPPMRRAPLALVAPPAAAPAPQARRAPAPGTVLLAAAAINADADSDAGPRSGTVPGPVFPAPDPQTLLLLLVQLDNTTLSDGMAAYGSPDDPLLPIGEMSRLLELDIDVSPADGLVTGRLGEARRALTIDIATHTARIGPVQVPLAADEVAVDPSDIYVRASVLAKLLPLTFAVDARALSMKLTATELLPIQGRLQRLARLRQGAPGPAAAEVMRVEEPYQLFTPPSFDVALSVGAQTISPRLPTRYDIRMGGDLLYAGLQAYVGSDESGRPTVSRVLLEKRSMEGDLLGPLHAHVFGLGDVFAPGLSIGPRSLGGRGFELSTTPLDQANVFNRIDLRGELPLGNDVELYVNDILQGTQQAADRGQYEFLNVPLTQGVNVVRIVTYGPRGQRSEQTRIINAGGGLLRPGQMTFEFGAIDQNEPLIRTLGGTPIGLDKTTGQPRIVASVNYGVAQYLTLSAGAALYTDNLGVERRLTTGGLRTAIAGFATQFDLARDNKGGEGASLAIAGRVLGANTVLRQSEYRGGLIDENNSEADIDRAVSRRTELTVDDNIRFGMKVVPLSLRALRDVYADGGSAWIGQLRGSTAIGSVLYSTGFEYDRNAASTGAVTERLKSFISASTFKNYKWQIRTTLDYDIIPDVRIADLNVTIDRAISNTWSLRFGATERLETPKGLELLAGSTTRTKFGDLTLTGQYDTADNSWRIGAQMNFGLGYNPATHDYQVTRSGPGSGGSVLFHAFVDANGNGKYDPGERPVSNVILEGGEVKVRTGPDGMVYLSGFGAAPRARLLVGVNEVENTQVKTPPAIIEFTPRPGGVMQIEYPMRPTGEVMVNVKLRRPDQQLVGLSAVRVRLVDEKGVVFEGVTEFDGSVNFLDVPATTYRVELDKDQAARLRMRMLAPVSITIKPDGSATPDASLEVEFAPRAPADGETPR